MEIREETIRVLDECLDLVTAAIVKRTTPCKDDITEHQAFQRYDRKWLRHRKKQGYIKTHRIGNRILYSVFEIECQRLAEKDYSDAFDRIYRSADE